MSFSYDFAANHPTAAYQGKTTVNTKLFIGGQWVEGSGQCRRMPVHDSRVTDGWFVERLVDAIQARPSMSSTLRTGTRLPRSLRVPPRVSPYDSRAGDRRID